MIEANTTPIYFDSRIKNSNTEIEDIIKSLVKGEATPGTRLEKLKNHKVFSLRINDKGRIIFTYTEVNNIKSLVVLEILENHEYDKSKFLKKNVLKRYLEKNQAEIGRLVQNDDFEESTIPDELIEPQANVYFEIANENKNSYVIFDEAQQNAFNAKTPLLIEGPPGSGKTLIAQGFIKQALENNAQKVLYVSPSANLARTVLRELSTSPEYDPGKVDVLTYEQLVQGGVEADGPGILKTWWKTLKVRSTEKSKLANWSKNLNAVYEEFKIISGVSKEEYLSENGIGKKQSLLGRDQSDRQLLCTLNERWLKHLEENAIKIRDFYRFSVDEIHVYDLIVVDETQYLSNIAIHNLLIMANNNIVLCSDRRQNPHDELQRNTQIKSMIFQSAGRQPDEHQLSAHYRCPKNIMTFAKVFNDIRTDMSKNLKSELKVVDSKISGGNVLWVEPSNKNDLLDLLVKLHNDPNACVVTSEKYREEAKVLGLKGLTEHDAQSLCLTNVLTQEEIVGLEFNTVILYKPLSTPQMKRVNQWLEKSRQQTEDLHAAAELSANFIASTRATQCMVMVQDSSEHNLANLIHALKESQKITETKEIAVIPTHAIETLSDEWESRAKEAAENGHIARAKAILSEHLSMYEEAQQNEKIQQWLSDGAVIPDVSLAKEKQNIPAKTKRKKNRQPIKHSDNNNSSQKTEKADPGYVLFETLMKKALSTGNVKPLKKELFKKETKLKPEYFTQTQGLLFLALLNMHTDCSDVLVALLKVKSHKYKTEDFTVPKDDGKVSILEAFAIAATNGRPICFSTLLKEHASLFSSDNFLFKVKSGKYANISILELIVDAKIKYQSPCLEELLIQFPALKQEYLRLTVSGADLFEMLNLALRGNATPLREAYYKQNSTLKAEHFALRSKGSLAESSGLFKLAMLSDEFDDIFKDLISNSADVYKPSDFSEIASGQTHEHLKGKSTLWFLAKLCPHVFLLVLDKYRFDTSVFTSRPQSGPDKGQSILWILAQTLYCYQAQEFIKVLSLYSKAFNVDDFTAQAQAVNFEGCSVLSFLANSISHSHLMKEILVQYPNAFNEEIFRAPAKEGPFKGTSILYQLYRHSERGHPEALDELLRQYPALQEAILMIRLSDNLRLLMIDDEQESNSDKTDSQLLSFQLVTNTNNQLETLTLEDINLPKKMLLPKTG